MNRAEFGEGRAGDKSWQLVVSGVTCAVCNKPAVGTTDFDVLGDLEQLGHCGNEHHEEIKRTVLADLAAQGRNTVVGKNGRGRA